MALQLRTKHRTLTNPFLVHLFSTSSSDPSDSSDPTEPNPQSHSSSVSDYFSDVKASLKQQSPQQQQSRPIAQNPSFFNTAHSRPSKAASLEEIRKNLSEFRRRSVGPNPTESNSAPWQRSSTAPNPSQQQHISFQDLFNKGVKSGAIEFQTIRENLKLIKPNANEQNERKGDGLALSKFTKSLGTKANDVVGRPGALPRLFDKELDARNTEKALKTEFVRIYECKELGEKLKKLRPEAKVGSWFTLRELSERLIKLREMDHNETVPGLGSRIFGDVRTTLVSLAVSEEEGKRKKTSVQSINLLSDLGQTPDYMLKPPKEVLVEKYFHPDNMSSAEKLKVELGKVRDEFKMSESDCGSARVQVAQLTTKIKHLSAVLHKKDKHSLKGLQAMVQRRKKLLKYLRRTDWDSYCLVLAKLGLRDTPDYKQEYKKHYKN
ncbi:hypothetical protein M0R45_031441 [Rubus argutus]|uniref:Small ribosomal subunit protein uS15c n=1 Tax=Rubus argutus TaxID=59490 RepID=A0AAW1WG71_RUBAR